MALLIMIFDVASALRTSIDVRPKQNEYFQERQRN